MDIVIIADFVGGLNNTDNNRFVYISKMLLKNKHNVELITSDFYHGTKQHLKKIDTYQGIKITMLNELEYKKNICIKRFLAHYLWGRRVFKYLKRRTKPDAIYCAMPTLTAAYLAAKYCKKNGIRFIIDVQDLWPEAFKMVFDVPIISNILFAPFRILANYAYNSANDIVAVSQTYLNRALKANKSINKGYSIYLGTDLSLFDSNIKKTDFLEKKPNSIWIGYCGTLGASYDLKIVFDAMKKYENRKVKFVIMGDGPRRKEFENYSKDLNVLFTGRLPYQQMCSVLSQCDIVVNPIMSKAAQSIINKHADYAASGKPIISSQQCKEYMEMIKCFKMGFNVSTSDEFADALKCLCENTETRLEMGTNSRKCAEILFDRRKTYLKIIKLIEED